MFKVMLAALSLSTCFSTMAASKSDRDINVFCDEVYNSAYAIMRGRQNGILIIDMLDIVDKVHDMPQRALTNIIYAAYYERARDLAYAQLMLTYTLTVSGLALVVLIRPPIRRTAGASPAHGPGKEWIGDWRPTLLALILLILVLVSASSPLIEWIFGITPLRQSADYGVVAVAVLAWVVAVSLFWWAASRVQRLRAPAMAASSDR